MEVAALLGLSEGRGNVALIGDMAGHATALAGLVPDVEFIGIAPGLRGWDEGEGVSRMSAGAFLPFSSGSLRGVGFLADRGPALAGASSVAGELPGERAGELAGELPGERAGELPAELPGELARVVAPRGRIAVWGAAEGVAREWEKALSSEGLAVLASEESAVVVTPTTV